MSAPPIFPVLEKQGENIEGLVRVKDAKGRQKTGHQMVMTHYRDGKKEYPLMHDLYRQKNTLEREQKGHLFRTKIQLALFQLQSLLLMGFPLGLVLFDAWYCSKEMVAWLQSQSLTFVSRLKSNRKISWEGEWIPVAALFKILPTTDFQRQRVSGWSRTGKKKCPRTFWTVRIQIRVHGLGEMTLVLSKRNRFATTGIVLLTNDPEMTTRIILELYNRRWSVEVFFRDAKQHLHLNDAIYRNLTAIKRHYYLVFWTYSLLVHLRCTGTIKRQTGVTTRTTRIMKQVVQQFMLETVITNLIQRLTSEVATTDIIRLLRDRQSWSFLKIGG